MKILRVFIPLLSTILLFTVPAGAEESNDCISLKEALMLSSDYFSERYKKMKLVFANKVDFPKCNGKKGKRRNWNIIVDSPKEKEKYLLFMERMVKSGTYRSLDGILNLIWILKKSVLIRILLLKKLKKTLILSQVIVK